MHFRLEHYRTVSKRTHLLPRSVFDLCPSLVTLVPLSYAQQLRTDVINIGDWVYDVDKIDAVAKDVADSRLPVAIIRAMASLLIEMDDNAHEMAMDDEDDDDTEELAGLPNAKIFLRQWSLAADFPLAFGHDDRIAILEVATQTDARRTAFSPIVARWAAALGSQSTTLPLVAGVVGVLASSTTNADAMTDVAAAAQRLVKISADFADSVQFSTALAGPPAT